jgi:phage tail-like protein
MAGKDEKRGKDVFVGLRFWIEIDGLEIASFDECSALTMETEMYDYSEGGLNTYTHKMPVRTKYSNITLKRGMDPSGDLFKWYCDTMDWYAQGPNGAHKRKNVTITLYNTKGDAVIKYHLRNAYPVKWTGPELKAAAGAVAVESLEFAHEGLVSLSNKA